VQNSFASVSKFIICFLSKIENEELQLCLDNIPTLLDLHRTNNQLHPLNKLQQNDDFALQSILIKVI